MREIRKWDIGEVEMPPTGNAWGKSMNSVRIICQEKKRKQFEKQETSGWEREKE